MGYSEVVELLIDHGAHVNLTNSVRVFPLPLTLSP
jgi:hypothetical protein